MARYSLILALLLGSVSMAVAQDDDHGHEEGEMHAEGEMHGDDHGEEHGHEEHSGGDDSDHLSELDGFRALHPWTNATSSDTTLIYVELENTGEAPVTLSGAETEHAETAQLVGFRLQGGEASYEDIAEMPVAPGRELVLAPNGLAIRLTGLDERLEEGGSFDMHLMTSLGELPVTVTIESAHATQHSHAGHEH